MKKVLVLFGILSVVPMAAFAYIEGSTSADVQTLKKQGFSENTLKVVDLVRSTSVGTNETYVRQYTPKKSNKIGKSYTRLKTYFDPIQEDDMFGEHQIEFSNTWLGDETSYTSGKTLNKNKKPVVENL